MDKIYFGGDIITLDVPCQAVAVSGGKIVGMGTKEEIFDKFDTYERVDLKGKTLMPSFIDAHSHFSAAANSLLQAPLDECTTFDEIADRLMKFKKENNVPDGEWIVAKGYDHNILENHCHPKRDFLDSVIPCNPVVLQHKSGHVGTFNSLGLEKLGVDENTPSPEGGMIEKENGKLTGYMEENAFVNYLKKVPMPTIEKFLDSFAKAQEKYFSYGITTCQEGMFVNQLVPIYRQLIASGILKIDVSAYAGAQEADEIFNQMKEYVKDYKDHFRIAGMKIFLDGSPQGRTAWMRKPYLHEASYCGYPTMQDKDVENAFRKAADFNTQILAHCNGDMACEQFLNSIEKVQDKPPFRPVMIHAQFLGEDQLDRAKALDVIASFFVAHTYYWGDVHIQNFGTERAFNISPAASALKKGVLFTFHQDAPVIEPDMFETVWCAVNRVSKKGVVMGENQKIDVLDAIKAVTINAAYQYGEEMKKGSISLGKNADLIIVSDNPLEIDKDKIKDIKVLETIKNGETVYKAQAFEN